MQRPSGARLGHGTMVRARLARAVRHVLGSLMPDPPRTTAPSTPTHAPSLRLPEPLPAPDEAARLRARAALAEARAEMPTLLGDSPPIRPPEPSYVPAEAAGLRQALRAYTDHIDRLLTAADEERRVLREQVTRLSEEVLLLRAEVSGLRALLPTSQTAALPAPPATPAPHPSLPGHSHVPDAPPPPARVEQLSFQAAHTAPTPQPSQPGALPVADSFAPTAPTVPPEQRAPAIQHFPAATPSRSEEESHALDAPVAAVEQATATTYQTPKPPAAAPTEPLPLHEREQGAHAAPRATPERRVLPTAVPVSAALPPQDPPPVTERSALMAANTRSEELERFDARVFPAGTIGVLVAISPVDDFHGLTMIQERLSAEAVVESVELSSYEFGEARLRLTFRVPTRGRWLRTALERAAGAPLDLAALRFAQGTIHARVAGTRVGEPHR